MRDYDEFDEERDLKSDNSGVYVTEYGDRLKRSDVYAGILLALSSIGVVACATIAGCKYIQKQIDKHKAQNQVMTNAVQKNHISVHDCR